MCSNRLASSVIIRKLLEETFLTFATCLIYKRRKVLKSGGTSSNVMGIMCPSGWNRVNYSANNWECHGHPGHPPSAVPALQSEDFQKGSISETLVYKVHVF